MRVLSRIRLWNALQRPGPKDCTYTCVQHLAIARKRPIYYYHCCYETYSRVIFHRIISTPSDPRVVKSTRWNLRYSIPKWKILHHHHATTRYYCIHVIPRIGPFDVRRFMKSFCHGDSGLNGCSCCSDTE